MSATWVPIADQLGWCRWPLFSLVFGAACLGAFLVIGGFYWPFSMAIYGAGCFMSAKAGGVLVLLGVGLVSSRS